MEQIAITWEPVRNTYTVAGLNARFDGMLEIEFKDIRVAGEISGCRMAASALLFHAERS